MIRQEEGTEQLESIVVNEILLQGTQKSAFKNSAQLTLMT